MQNKKIRHQVAGAGLALVMCASVLSPAAFAAEITGVSSTDAEAAGAIATRSVEPRVMIEQQQALSFTNGQAAVLTRDLMEELPHQDMGTYKDVTFAIKSVDLPEAYYEAGTAELKTNADTGKTTMLELPIKASDSEKSGKLGTVTITVSYTVTDLEGNDSSFGPSDFTIDVQAADPVTKHTVTFLDGYTTMISWTTEVNHGEKIVLTDADKEAILNESREGYVLLGYFADGSETAFDFDNDVVNENLTLIAKWEVAAYKNEVTLDANGGKVQQVKSSDESHQAGLEKVTSETGVGYLHLRPAYRDGYVFLGWYDAAEGGNAVWLPENAGETGYTCENVNAIPDSDHTLYAHWKKADFAVTPTFQSIMSIEPVGGKGEAIPGTIDDIYYGSFFTVKAVVDEAIEIDSVSVRNSLGGYSALSDYTPEKGSVLLWAHETMMDGFAARETKDWAEGDCDIILTVKTADGKVGVGVLPITIQEGARPEIRDLGVRNHLTGTYELNPASTGVSSTDKTDVRVTGYTMVMDSRYFTEDSAYISVDGTSVCIPVKNVDTEDVGDLGRVTIEYSYTDKDGEAQTGKTVFLLKAANDLSVKKSVRFTTGDGSAVDALDVFAGTRLEEPDDPTLDDYYFAGWFVDNDCTVPWDFNTDRVTNDLMLYAKWTATPPVTYTVQFDTAGGNAITSVDVLEGQRVTKPMNPARDGYKFLGWFYENEDGETVAWDFTTQTVTKAVTLTASWEKLPVPHTITFESNGGSAIDDATVMTGDKITKPADPTWSGYKFEGWYSDSDCKTVWNFETGTVSGDMTLYAKWTRVDSSTKPGGSGSGSISGGSSIGGGGGSVTTPGTSDGSVTNSDGSVTTTTTDKKTGVVTETTKYKDGSQLIVKTSDDGKEETKVAVDGSTETTTTKTDGSVTYALTGKDGTTATVSDNESGYQAEVKLSEEKASQYENNHVKLSVPSARMEGKPVSFRVDVGEKTDVPVALPVQGTTINTLITMKDNKTGKESVVRGAKDSVDGKLVMVSGDVTFSFKENLKTFTDTSNHWAQRAIQYAAGQELFNGVSETEFAPNSAMTRGMFMTVLARYNNVDTTQSSVWYQDGMNWSVDEGISDGSNPMGNITREQIVTMLYRMCGSPDVPGSLSKFVDGSSVSSYAVDAMNWAVEKGLMQGKDGNRLDPTGNATRAEVATLLQRFEEAMSPFA